MNDKPGLTLNTGDVIAFSEITINGALVKKITGWNINHVGIMINSNVMMEVIFPRGVRCIPFVNALNRKGDKYAYKLDRVSRLKLNIESFGDFIELVKDKKYDYYQTVLLGINQLLFKLDYKEDLSRMFCSKLIGGALRAGEILDKNINVSKLTPFDIVNLPIYEKKIKLDFISGQYLKHKKMPDFREHFPLY